MAYFWVYLNTMRRRGLFFGVIHCAGFLSASSVFGQNNEVADQAKEAIKAGSAKELSKHLHQTVDVTIDGNLKNYSKTQAEFLLRDFFKAHPPSEFSIIHQGSSKGG